MGLAHPDRENGFHIMVKGKFLMGFGEHMEECLKKPADAWEICVCVCGGGGMGSY